MVMRQADKFIFGIYPGSRVGIDIAESKPDNPIRIQQALHELQGDRSSFLVRCYIHYKGKGDAGNTTPERFAQYAVDGRKLDLVICHQTDEEPLDGWLACISHAIDAYSEILGHLQIAEEVSVKDLPLDGYYGNSLNAMISGVITAKNEIARRGLDIKVGINATPSFGPDIFWEEVGDSAPKEFFDSLDYIGLDFFPDVFRSLPIEKLEQMAGSVLEEFRRNASNAGVSPDIPLFITENGWPTGRGRPPEVQADVLARVLHAALVRKDELNIGGYEYFSLRDLASGRPDWTIMHGFGLMDDDYLPKPAFGLYRDLIREYSRG